MTDTQDPVRAHPVAHRVEGGGGIGLSVLEAGDPAGPPILFLHGFCQSALAWRPLFQGPLAARFRLLALDLRGHGGSDRPSATGGAPGPYADGDLWADDVAGALDGLGVEKAVLVGWSYGGAVLADHLRRHGAARVAGIVLAGACPRLGPAARPFMGPLGRQHFPALMGGDFAAQVAACRALAHGMTVAPVAAEDLETGIAATMSVPPAVRWGMMRREADFDPVLAAYGGPALIVHGAEDPVVLPDLARHLAGLLPQARLHLYDGVGHAPFQERPDRFAADLAAFMDSV
ncbi:alpha/beta fold hydrolase [Rhodocista pekingensis]|uniref:Alpha/beta fold hydrolase n=1 Tax=Rhodocista pekingensis TaxID=201185 RepID=A0ABW2KT62_9PROT